MDDLSTYLDVLEEGWSRNPSVELPAARDRACAAVNLGRPLADRPQGKPEEAAIKVLRFT